MDMTTTSPLAAAVATRIDALRKERGISLRAFARKLETDYMYVWRRLSSDQTLDLGDVEAMAAALDVTVADLLEPVLAGQPA